MKRENKSFENVKQAWCEATDQAVYKALTTDINEYPLEVQAIIKEEAQKRDLTTEAILAQEPLKKKISRETKKTLIILCSAFAAIITFILLSFFYGLFVRDLIRDLIKYLFVE